MPRKMIRVSLLEGGLLNYYVAKALELKAELRTTRGELVCWTLRDRLFGSRYEPAYYASSWHFGSLLFSRLLIDNDLTFATSPNGRVMLSVFPKGQSPFWRYSFGATELEALARAFVASKLGLQFLVDDEVVAV